MTAQLELAPWLPSKDGGRLADALRGRGWVTARELRPLAGLNDRQLRSEAEASGGAVISGQNGYCLWNEATVEELYRSSDWLISQGRKMIARGIAIRRRSHARPRTAQPNIKDL